MPDRCFYIFLVPQTEGLIENIPIMCAAQGFHLEKIAMQIGEKQDQPW